MRSKNLLLSVFLIMITLTGCVTFFSAILQENRALNIPEANSTTNDQNVAILLSHLIYQDSNCNLPCIGGLVPGISSTNEVQSFFDTLDTNGFSVFEYLPNNYSVEASDGNGSFMYSSLSLDDNLLQSATITIVNPRQSLENIPFELADIFSQLGTPDDVLILLAGPPLRFTLVVVYNDLGVMTSYSAVYNDQALGNSNANLPICLNSDVVDLERIEVWMQNPLNDALVEENIPDLRQDREIRPWWTIQRMANVTVAEFVDFFVSNPEECFLLPSLTELREQGYIP